MHPLVSKPFMQSTLLELNDARRYEEAFNAALDLGDVNFVAWLCGQVEPQEVLASTPPLLSQQVLLVLLQQLGYDLSTVSHSQAL